MGKPSELVTLERLLASFDGLDSFGLLFLETPGPSHYEETPKNCSVFASTGGDGVHYSFLDLGNGISGACPIVMTVPMAEAPNRVVGRDLLHFLGLGLHSGYFVLEQLQHDFAATCGALDRKQFWQFLSDEERAALSAIERQMGARPWNDHAARLAGLASEYGDLLRFD
ncbi:hypothetical protein G6N82_03060 [Altererythrobacter sp. BO-6]|uniref:hypothetical protein n=1 Tax=Altererythrobacter sp. BO-6 TaxID=2604537 RepID=UPI0013E12F15|nr:hypothetical protein [Altererythrobacter sp. BO-6]QIG53265.1 hypothetical protein G6N82_03060 [Altererythrobacter sp. BO-6]